MDNSKKLLLIVVSWILIGALISVYDHFVLLANFSDSANRSYSLLENLTINLGVGGIAAISGGSFIVLYVNRKYHTISYWKTILLVAASFLIVSSILVVLVSIAQSIIHSTSLKYVLFDTMHLKNILIWSIVVAMTQFMIQIDLKFGKGVLLNLITGRYHQPREETRIFMMLDIVSSTQIAERLERDRYHLFLRDFFADITQPILLNRGEIYQYVGDEVVVSWKLKNGSVDTSCLKCFFDMQQAILQKEDKYKLKYETVPEFKAGLHYGKVIAGEIGVIKKDITYSGDVLNTVSRIQGKCNEYGVRILASDELLLLLPISSDFNRIAMGEIELRGKQNKVCLSTLEIQKR